VKTLNETLEEIEKRAEAAMHFNARRLHLDKAIDDVPKLLAMLRLAIEQRDTAYTCSWDKDLGSMIADDDLALLAVGRGENG
jgi:hypothetical protein